MHLLRVWLDPKAFKDDGVSDTWLARHPTGQDMHRVQASQGMRHNGPPHTRLYLDNTDWSPVTAEMRLQSKVSQSVLEMPVSATEMYGRPNVQKNASKKVSDL